MYQKLFGSPIWVTKVNPKQLNLQSKNFKPNWYSKTLSSFSDNSEDNFMDKQGLDYLLSKATNCLMDVGITKVKLISIWRNIYQNSFQERHMHAKSHFSFTIYEKLTNPQTVFYHPAHDMIYALGLEKYINPVITPNIVEGDMIIFPSYLDHMVQRTENSMTISGNFEIEQ